MKPSPTLALLASRAGVSASTVSRALRGHPALSDGTIRKVQKIAAELGYRQNPLISSVMRRFRGSPSGNVHGNIGYLTFGPTATAWREHFTYLQFFEGARNRAEELGFVIDEIWADQPGMTTVRLHGILHARGITGVILGPTPGLPQAPNLDWSQLAPVKIGVPYPDLPLPCAMPNQYHAMQRVLERLHTYGYRRPGLVLENHQNIKTSAMWLTPFSYFAQQPGPDDRVAPLILEEWSKPVFTRWFETHRPDVLIGLRPELILWVNTLGYTVPDDVGFVNLGAEPGKHAGMDQRPEQIGAAACDLVIGRLLANERGLPEAQRLLLIDSVWMDGPSLKRRRQRNGRKAKTGTN